MRKCILTSDTITERANALFMAMQLVADGALARRSLTLLRSSCLEQTALDGFKRYRILSCRYHHPVRTENCRYRRHQTRSKHNWFIRIRGYMLSEEFKLKADIEMHKFMTLTGSVDQAETAN